MVVAGALLDEAGQPEQPSRDGNVDADCHLEGVRLLAVDDEPDARELISEYSAPAVQTVESAGSARRRWSCSGKAAPDVLITDITMSGKDGCTLIGRYARLNAKKAATFQRSRSWH